MTCSLPYGFLQVSELWYLLSRVNIVQVSHLSYLGMVLARLFLRSQLHCIMIKLHVYFDYNIELYTVEMLHV